MTLEVDIDDSIEPDFIKKTDKPLILDEYEEIENSFYNTVDDFNELIFEEE